MSSLYFKPASSFRVVDSVLVNVDGLWIWEWGELGLSRLGGGRTGTGAGLQWGRGVT